MPENIKIQGIGSNLEITLKKSFDDRIAENTKIHGKETFLLILLKKLFWSKVISGPFEEKEILRDHLEKIIFCPKISQFKE